MVISIGLVSEVPHCRLITTSNSSALSSQLFAASHSLLRQHANCAASSDNGKPHCSHHIAAYAHIQPAFEDESRAGREDGAGIHLTGFGDGAIDNDPTRTEGRI